MFCVDMGKKQDLTPFPVTPFPGMLFIADVSPFDGEAEAGERTPSWSKKVVSFRRSCRLPSRRMSRPEVNGPIREIFVPLPEFLLMKMALDRHLLN